MGSSIAVKQPIEQDILQEIIEEVDAYQCPSCESLHDDQYDAAHCCPREAEGTYAYQCPECKELHQSRQKAFDCCVEQNLLLLEDDSLPEGLVYQLNQKRIEDLGQQRLF